MEAISFDQWWKELQQLAEEADFVLGDKDGYCEFFDDGDSPEDTLDMLLESSSDTP